MNLPNKLTVCRIILAPVFLFLFCAENIPHNFLLALIIFIVASVTDFADGRIARKNNIVTDFGKIADPIADKILTTAVLLCFISIDLCSIWVILIILTREFTISAIRITAASHGIIIPANIYGKIKTISQMIVSIVILTAIVLSNENIYIVPYLNVISSVLLWITALITAISGIVYIKDSMELIDFKN